MLHNITGWLLGAVVLGVGSLFINAILVLLKLGNIKTILFLTKLRSALKDIPDDMLLSCNGREVVLMHFDVSKKTEKVIPVYTGVVTWKGGPRLASKIKRKVRRQLTFRSLPLMLIFIPLIIASLWVTLFHDWRGVFIALMVVVHQFFPFYLWDYPGLSGLFEGD